MLRYFMVVAQELHFGNAAKKLNISQPPLSVQIKELEYLLNAPLFIRTSRKVALTDTGELLKIECAKLFDILDRSLNKVSQHTRNNKSILKIGVVSSSLWEGLLNIINNLKEKNSNLHIEFIEMGPNQQKDSLLKGEIDMGVCRQPDTFNCHPLSSSLIFKEAMVVAVPSTHEFNKRKQISLTELSKECYSVLSRENSQTTNILVNECELAGFHPNIVHEVKEPQAMLAFVAAQQAIAFVPEYYADIKWRDIKFIKLKEYISADLYLLYDQKNQISSVTEFIEAADKYRAEMSCQ